MKSPWEGRGGVNGREKKKSRVGRRWIPKVRRGNGKVSQKSSREMSPPVGDHTWLPDSIERLSHVDNTRDKNTPRSLIFFSCKIGHSATPSGEQGWFTEGEGRDDP